MIDKWDKFFVGMAKYVSRASKDPSTQVGAVLVSPDRTDIVIGYNGFPRGMSDDPALYADRNIKYPRTVHAEINAVILARRSVAGYTLYTWPCISCDRCSVHMVQAGIARHVAPKPTDDMESRWSKAFVTSRENFAEAKIPVIEIEPELLDAAS